MRILVTGHNGYIGSVMVPVLQASRHEVVGPDNYSLVLIPPNVWNGFKGMSEPYGVVANCATHTHDPGRSTRLDPVENHIPYDWSAKHQ